MALVAPTTVSAERESAGSTTAPTTQPSGVSGAREWVVGWSVEQAGRAARVVFSNYGRSSGLKDQDAGDCGVGPDHVNVPVCAPRQRSRDSNL
jgi:hypothetical protein